MTIDKFSTAWDQSFYQEYTKQFGDHQQQLVVKVYCSMFSEDYKTKFNAQDALSDLSYLKSAVTNNKAIFNLSHLGDLNFQLKIYSSADKPISLNILSCLQHLNFKVLSQQTFKFMAAGDFTKSSLLHQVMLSIKVKHAHQHTHQRTHLANKLSTLDVEDVLDKISLGLFADDILNKLVVVAGLNWRQVQLLTALTQYLQQTGFTYQINYVQRTLLKHHQFSRLLIDLFTAKFAPKAYFASKVAAIDQQIITYIDSLSNSSVKEHKVLQRMLLLIHAVVRTNFYQSVKDSSGDLAKSYLALKFSSKQVPDLPQPIPYAEIFVFANNFVGIHLRGGKVARGGIRWSDRALDYRTEILALMKAQMTKNALVVPVGSKGGFVPLFSQEAMGGYKNYIEQVIECYKNFLRGLLDLTDNIVDGKVIHPEDTLIYDEQDPYLVVAADKGTATFSDYANSIAAEYNFWLGDAFASGGSTGYDHKKMAITAKGVWVSVSGHFKELGIDGQRDLIKVVGIGDMAGDVFGNGMLLSDTIQLVAAFNHLHIFIDPTPDAKLSFAERQRLFKLPGSRWSDYNPQLISPGGGVFARALTSIPLNSEIKKLLTTQADELTPQKLIKAILTAKVDLIWNGGIGTYIKASQEQHAKVADKANDLLRCDGRDIRAKVIAEGGNLGVSQQGRIEYSKQGGRINTDFIDNSAGVDCSDHEVNIKIALNQALTTNKLSLTARNEILASMTEEVEELVLLNNHKQTQSITISRLSSAFTVNIFAELISILAKEKLFLRSTESLPTKVELKRRFMAKEHIMLRPELALLLSYSKMAVYNKLSNTKLSEDRYFIAYLINYFPQTMHQQFASEIINHPLKAEIINTIIANSIVNQLGGFIVSVLKAKPNGDACDLIRAYVIILEIFDLTRLWQAVEELPKLVDDNIKVELFAKLSHTIHQGMLWIIKNLDQPLDINSTINKFKEQAQTISQTINNLLVGEAKIKFQAQTAKYRAYGLDIALATSIATLDHLLSYLDIIYVIVSSKAQNTKEAASLYFKIGDKFSIDWLRQSCKQQISDADWQQRSIQSLTADFYDKQRKLLMKISNHSPRMIDLDWWINNNLKFVKIFIDFVADIKVHENINLNMIILANKKLAVFLHKLK